jgi:hypothetical protein
MSHLKRVAPWLAALGVVLLVASHGALLYAAWSRFAIPALIVGVVAMLVIVMHVRGRR